MGLTAVLFFSRYERLLRRAQVEDLTEVSGIGCLYQSGVDRLGRPVIVFCGKWFPAQNIDLEKVKTLLSRYPHWHILILLVHCRPCYIWLSYWIPSLKETMSSRTSTRWHPRTTIHRCTGCVRSTVCCLTSEFLSQHLMENDILLNSAYVRLDTRRT